MGLGRRVIVVAWEIILGACVVIGIFVLWCNLTGPMEGCTCTPSALLRVATPSMIGASSDEALRMAADFCQIAGAAAPGVTPRGFDSRWPKRVLPSRQGRVSMSPRPGDLSMRNCLFLVAAFAVPVLTACAQMAAPSRERNRC